VFFQASLRENYPVIRAKALRAVAGKYMRNYVFSSLSLSISVDV
jgi:hypothetical protein